MDRARRKRFDFTAARPIARRGGLIPIGGRVKPFAAERVLLAGDAAGLVSPLTAGGIHTALESGWCAAHAIVDFVQDQGHDPARVAAKAYPRFVCKRSLRWLADLPPPNWLYDALLGTAPARRLASAIYFHRRSASMTAEQEDGYSPSADR
jgi:digeranylgeranylglycerophospholipid reductase